MYLESLLESEAREEIARDMADHLTSLRTIVRTHQLQGSWPGGKATVAGFEISEGEDGSLVFRLPADMRR